MVIAEVLELSGAAAHEVNYVETHSTGTRLGDPIEVQALAAVLGAGRTAANPLRLASVKTNIGHLEAAAGIAGLIKVVLALQHEELPRHLNLVTPNPHIPWDSLPVQVVTENTPWPRGQARRLAGVSSFGFSGTNVHVLLEEAPAPTARPATLERPMHVLALSARTEPALRELTRRHERRLAEADEPFADLCFTANAGRSHFEHRLAVVAESAAEARQHLADDDPSTVCRGQAKGRPRLAFLFPGQGCQYVGMGRTLFESEPTFKKALLSCERLLTPYLPRPLTEVLFEETGLLDRTEYTQPALFALEYALAQLWQGWGITPDIVLGHSVGEYVAACVAGVFSLEDGIKLITERARLMGALPAGGTMAAVFADEERVRALLAAHADCVSIAALNGPANTVLSGTVAAIEAVRQTLDQQGVRSVPLAVSHAFHSHLLEPMLERFEAVAATVRYTQPQVGLISNLTGRLMPERPPPTTGGNTRPAGALRRGRASARRTELLGVRGSRAPAPRQPGASERVVGRCPAAHAAARCRRLEDGAVEPGPGVRRRRRRGLGPIRSGLRTP